MPNNLYNIYCDESCHLEYDHEKVMVLGALWCLDEVRKDMFTKIRDIKKRHGLSQFFEVKWTKISPAKIDFYKELITFFFNEDDLHFRSVVIKDKDKLRHQQFKQTHDDWYYKMFFCLLKVILDPHARYRIYLDKKDTRSGDKINKLQEILCNNQYDFSKQIIETVQSVHSHEIELLQITDLLIGAIGYVNRGLKTSEAKDSIVRLIKEMSGYHLSSSTLLKENKMNLFFWTPNMEGGDVE